MPGVEFRPQALIKGAAWVGYRKFVPESPKVLPGFQGLVADLSLSYTLLSATTFGVAYRRDLTYSYEEFQPFFVDESVGASIRRALGTRFDVLVSADRHRYEYQNIVPLDGPALPDRLDTTWRLRGQRRLPPRQRRARRVRRVLSGTDLEHESVPRLRQAAHRLQHDLRVLAMQHRTSNRLAALPLGIGALLSPRGR